MHPVSSATRRYSLLTLLVAVALMAIAMRVLVASAAPTAPTLPILWTAGGHDAGTSGAGQAARIVTLPSGNVAILSAPFLGSNLAVTVYTASGDFLWRNSVAPTTGTFVGDWIVAAPNGDFVVAGHSLNASGHSVAVTLARFAADGTFLWRADPPGLVPSVGRLVVDSAGNAYLLFNSLGDGQDIRLHKYSATGTLLWSRTVVTTYMSNDIATSLALSPDESEIVLSGNVTGGTAWLTALYDTQTGTRRWLVDSPVGIAARDVVMDDATVYVTGMGNIGITGYLTVVAYDRATGAELWRTDTKPADSSGAAGNRLSRMADGSLAVAGQATGTFLDWYIVLFESDGTIRWEAFRDGGLNSNEYPNGVLVLPDETIVVTGRGGPNLPGGFIQGVTVGYAPDGTSLWEAYARMESVWLAALPAGDVCATGGYDALVTCWDVPGGGPGPTPTPTPPTAGERLHLPLILSNPVAPLGR